MKELRIDGLETYTYCPVCGDILGPWQGVWKIPPGSVIRYCNDACMEAA